MERTLVILRLCIPQRELVGKITRRFECKGSCLAKMKMMRLTGEVSSEHYSYLSSKPFPRRVKDSMMTAPVIVCCSEGVDVIRAVRALAGPTNGCLAAPGIVRGDYSTSFQENIVRTPDSPEAAIIKLNRFFKPEEISDYKRAIFSYLYADDEH